MKLLTRYSRINILSSVVIFVFASIAFYILLHFVLLNQVDRDLKIEEHEIQLYVERFNKLPDAMPVKNQKIYYHLANDNDKERIFSTISLTTAYFNERERYRQLRFFITARQKKYVVFVEKSLKETENITRSIVFISLATIMAMLAAGFIINRLLIKKLWEPFYTSLSFMKKFRLSRTENITFQKTNIDEFNDLNKALEESIESAQNEYRQLKEFTENASHELQTPLAVIRSKMDVLIQDEKLSESQSNLVQSTYEALQKLARLNQSMLLLNKIENRQFSETSDVDIKQLMEQKLAYFKELIDAKNISVSATLLRVVKKINVTLIDILLNNLFSNAIRYTPEGGEINIILNERSFVFNNSPQNGSLNRLKMFNRFYKGEQSSDNHGLGLSIVKQIYLVLGFMIEYDFTSGKHNFEVAF